MELVEHIEGTTRLLVPPASLKSVPPPTAPVFFNPAASLNRDVTVAVTAATGGSTFCDAMAGVGARGVRVASEVERIDQVALADFNGAALQVAERAAALNRVTGKCGFSRSETTSFLFSRYGEDERFDYVDVDPFGTPVRQLQAGVSATSTGGILSVTATDTAVLCGVYPRVSLRRYGARSVGNHFSHETAVRLLAGALARAGAQLDVGVEPVFAHSTRHYIRLFTRVKPGATSADGSLGHLGYVMWCAQCGHASSSEAAQPVCLSCGKKARVAGPLWLGGLEESETLRRTRAAAAKMSLDRAAILTAAFEGVDGFPPWSFSIERASSTLKAATVPEEAVRRALEEKGWRTMRTPFEKTGVKTDAPFKEFADAVRSSAPRGRAG